ncbi:MAG TPA: efflux RND transporter periplasmic adaptor subunit [Chitinophagaceae bacterium]|nr:efflux RND transporter periplasmic adaptor subunit [Chitinophagaceae bacterium]MCB9054366.1 efflux RND transporter periplasmic adaptor subunit [Chitinophagales bacterium]HPG10766.1 efflux RND transporter periplasmic adaptor subunit [Chitinophagaceae bacterium]HRX93842.1 efflux RND transporter periplasmic adaptor subunit [Chitinophagaceae bacterium]
MKKYIIIVISIFFVFASCKDKKTTLVNKDEYYTCSMHPQIMQDKPGTCPICHMELIVVKKTNTAADEIMLNDEQIRLGNIQTDTIRNGMIGDKVILTATLNTDETKVNSINARIMGRIDRLYFKNMGDFVSKGAHLYDLYSEELNNAKQEYIAALEKQQTLDNSIIDFNRLVQSAKQKLLLWGMSEAQVNELAKTKKASPLTSFYSNESGFITELPVMEGQYVSEGSTVVKLANLSSLWAEAQVYTSQLSAIDLKGTATVQFPDIPGKEWKGSIEFANPEIVSDSRLNLVRVSIPNPNGLLKPGMPAYVIIKSKELNTLTLPSDAVLRDGKMNTVWVQSGKNRYKMKMVQTGMETGDRLEIKSGLQNGDVVVTRGAYLLNSEFVFKKGANAMGGMDMSGHQH